ncbi:hypothetical protein [Brooklawnia sp.]
MIRIDQETPEPPSADDLRALWDKQMAKIEQANPTTASPSPAITPSR